MRRLLLLGCWCVGLTVAQAQAMGVEPPSSPYTVRVAIAQRQSRIEVSVHGDYRILDLRSHDVLQHGPSLARVAVSVAPAGIMLGDRLLPLNGLRVESLREIPVQVDDRQVRGAVDISRQSDGTLLVVNQLNLDAYLFGVLHHETSRTWALEALKAQAIASRTYALYQAQLSQQTATPRAFDLSSTVASQVYGGRTSERWRTSRAVRETYGLVLTYNGRLFPAYFHATCGGQTEAPSLVWSGEQPPLRSVACPWCITAPHYRWTRELMQRDLVDKLHAHHLFIERIASIAVAERTPSGRAVRLRCEGPGGPVEVAAKELRDWLGPNWLKSLTFDVHMDGYKIVFEGHGWGHGVGMCQWGAAEMANRGRTAEEILQFYYPGAVLQPLPLTNSAPVATTVSTATPSGGP